MTNLPDLERRVSGVNAQLGKAYVTGAKEAKSLSLSLSESRTNERTNGSLSLSPPPGTRPVPAITNSLVLVGYGMAYNCHYRKQIPGNNN